MKTKFRWTDARVKAFNKIACSGSYGDYKDCKTIEAKLKRFKELETQDPEDLNKEYIITLSFPSNKTDEEIKYAITRGLAIGLDRPGSYIAQPKDLTIKIDKAKKD